MDMGCAFVRRSVCAAARFELSLPKNGLNRTTWQAIVVCALAQRFYCPITFCPLIVKRVFSTEVVKCLTTPIRICSIYACGRVSAVEFNGEHHTSATHNDLSVMGQKACVTGSKGFRVQIGLLRAQGRRDTRLLLLIIK